MDRAAWRATAHGVTKRWTWLKQLSTAHWSYHMIFILPSVNLVYHLTDFRMFNHSWRKLSAEELMLLNHDVGEDSWESLGLQGYPTSPFWRSALGFLWKEWCQSWNSSTLTTSCEELTHGKDSDAGGDWEQEEKGMTEDEMAGWHHWLDGHESEWTPEVGNGQGGLACCDSWGHKESDMTEQLNWSELNISLRVTVNICLINWTTTKWSIFICFV